MSTITDTETKETKVAASCLKIKSSVQTEKLKTGQTEIKTDCSVKEDTKMKKNKNATLRKSRSAQNYENINPEQKESRDDNQEVTETQASTSERNWEGDSAIGSSTYSDMSFDSLLDRVDDFQLHDTEEKSPKSKGAEGWSPQSNSGPKQPVFYTPKLPVSTRSSAVHDVKRKIKFQRDKIQPFQIKPERNAFQKQSPHHDAFVQPEIDGEISQKIDDCGYPVYPELDEESLSSGYSITVSSMSSSASISSITSSSLSSCSKGGMLDFVILHTEDDHEEAGYFMEHLLKDLGISDLTVDLFSDIDAGKPGMQSLGTLHDTYRYILTFVTENLESDKYCRFINEIILTLGLREANGKEDRVVPVFTKNGYCKILELSILGGLQYHRFHSSNSRMKESYMKCIKTLVKTGRQKFP